MKSRYLIFLFSLLSIQDISGQCLYSADYYTYNNFCDLDSLYLTAHPLNGTGPYTYLWATGDTTQTISIPLALADYLVTITDSEGCTIVISCHVKPYPQVLFYPFNQNACFGDTVTLFLDWFRDSIPGATYLWSTGETTSSILITDDITWSATVTDPNTGCEYILPPSFFDFHPTPYPEIVGPDILCSGQSIILTAIGGPFGTLIWYPGGFYEDSIEVLFPGTYTVWGSSPEAGYCWHVDSIVITEADINPPILSGPPDLCDGQTGTISIDNSNEFISFLWSNNQSTPSISVTQSGTYTVTVTNDGGCTATGEFTIEPGPGPSLSISTSPSTCGENNGNINLTPSPSGNYTFEWSNGGSTEDLVNIPAGSYEVTVTDANGCSTIASATVPDNPIVITLTATIVPNTSCQVNNGGIDLAVSPVGTYTYLWSNGSTTQDLFNLQAGTYTITVTTGVTCTSIGEYIVTDQSSSPSYTASTSAAICGEENGNIDINMNGGSPPFTFIWSNGSDQEDLINIPAGNYAVTITGADGCESTDNYSIPDSIIPISINGLISPNTSCTGENGMIDITISPTAFYTFLWSTGETTEDINNLGEGQYTVTVAVGNTCQTSGDFLLENNFSSPIITGITLPNTSCSQPNGSVDITVDPDGSYTYLWSNGETTEDIQDVTGGIYNVIITNAEGCTGTAIFTVDNTSSSYTIENAITPNTSCIAFNGSIDLTIIPSGSYTFLWSNGATTEDLPGLSAGSYGVTVSDLNSCSTVAVFSIADQLSYPSIDAEIIPALCGGVNGAINLNVIPQTGNSFAWSTGATSEDLQNLTAGIYTVTVTNTLNCMASDTFVVMDNTMIPIVTSTITPAVCGANNGAIDIIITPAGNYVYSWSNGDITEDLFSVAAGTYSVIVSDTNGCQALDTFDINNTNSNFSISASPLSNTSCIAPNGTIDVSIAPVGVYTFAWSNGALTEDIFNLSAGSYTVTVTDSTSCSSIQTFIIGEAIPLITVSSTINSSLCGMNNGSIDVNISPSGGYTFLWSNGESSEDLQNLTSGEYSLTVTNPEGCTVIDTFTVPTLGSSFTMDAILSNNTNCTPPNGAIDLSVFPAGLYTYEWSNGAVSEDLSSLVPGLYIVTVSDENGCSSTTSFTLSDQTIQPQVTEFINPSTCGLWNGQIDINVNPPGTYIFNWSDGSTNEDLINIPSGTYTVIVASQNGCSVMDTFSVTNVNSNFSFTAITSVNSNCTQSNGAINLTVLPSGLYTFLWSNGAISEDLFNLQGGSYSVTVSDGSGCSSADTFVVMNSLVDLEVKEIITPVLCGEANGSIDLSVVPSSGNTYNWSNGSTSEDIADLFPGIYSVTITTQSGCSSTFKYTVDGTEKLDISLQVDDMQSGNDLITILAEVSLPVSAIDTMIWLPETLFSCFQEICFEQTITRPSKQTEITVMVLDTNGCLAQARLTIDDVVNPEVFIPNVFSPNGDGINDLFTVYGNKDVELVEELQIFDRWGNQIFSKNEFPPNEENYGWDGSFKHEVMNPAVFVYWARVRYTDGSKGSFKGDITLIR
ncbi:MAG TPA: T9SS type B sorting domain-containing protein [Saprospiraceae bacterium]